MNRAWLITLVLSVAGAIGCVWGPWPPGIPSEWTWATIPGSAVTVVVALGLGIVGAVYIAAVDRLGSTYAAGSLLRRSALAIGLVAILFAWFSIVREPIDWLKPGAGRSRDPWVLYAPGMSGYFTEARKVEDTRAFLATYEQKVAEGDYLHQGTHPPGLILGFIGLYSGVDAIPLLQSLADSAMSTPFRNSLDVISETQGEPLGRRDRAVLWWASVITQLSLAMVALPIVAIVAQGVGHEVAWRTAALWAFVPAGVVFLPKSDCVYAVFAVLVVWLWCRALHGSYGWAIAAGLIASLSLWLSLAFGPIYVGIAGASIYLAIRNRNEFALCVATRTIAAVGAGLIPIAVGFLSGLNIINVWIGNLRNHATFYDHNQRTFLVWLPANLIEGVIAAGLPLVAAAFLLTADRRSARDGPSKESAASLLSVCASARVLTLGVLTAWVALWLSGKNMGEAARLWILLTPFPLLALGMAASVTAQQWRAIAVAALIAFLGIVLRVDGFDLSGRAIGL